MIAVAIDIGGTFTDLVGFDDKTGRFVDAKSLTTPHDLVQGIIDCLNKSGLAAGAIDELIHGSTIAINTLIERTGAKTALVVTNGTSDVYIIGRGNRPEAYNSSSIGIARWCRGISPGRSPSGCWPPARSRDARPKASRRSARALAAEGVDAVAVCFLHSYINPDHERAAGEIIRAALPDAYVSLSHEILARVPRVRAHLDDSGERLYRPQSRRLCTRLEGETRRRSALRATCPSCARTAA